MTSTFALGLSSHKHPTRDREHLIVWVKLKFYTFPNITRSGNSVLNDKFDFPKGNVEMGQRGRGSKRIVFFLLEIVFPEEIFLLITRFQHLLILPFLISHAQPKEIPFRYSNASHWSTPSTNPSHKWLNEWREDKMFFHLFSGIHRYRYLRST